MPRQARRLSRRSRVLGCLAADARRLRLPGAGTIIEVLSRRPWREQALAWKSCALGSPQQSLQGEIRDQLRPLQAWSLRFV